MNLRDVLNPEIGIVSMSSEWLEDQVLAAVIIDESILKIALRDVPKAPDCTRIGLGHGQCVEVKGSLNPVTAIMDAMEEQMAVMNGCNFYMQLWDSNMAKACALVGIKEIYYTNGSTSDDEVKAFKTCGVEIIRVSL